MSVKRSPAARTVEASVDTSVADRILEEAARLFFRQGYGASSIRDLAAAVDISSSTLYHHYANKEAILTAILERFMRDFNGALLPILADTRRPPGERLRAAVIEHLVFSQRRHTELLNGHPFRHALGKRTLARIIGLQRVYRDAVIKLLAEGTRAGIFHVADATVTTMVLLDALNGLREWFRPDGGEAIEVLAETYAGLALRLCGAAEPAPRRPRRR